ncbi:MAG: hypothetical protein WCA01_12345 [Burkholderiales bacterium]
MKRTAIVTAFAASLLLGSFAAEAKLPPPAPMSDAEKAATAEKAKAAAGKAAAELAAAEERAVANYRRNKGIATPAPEKPGKKKR